MVGITPIQQSNIVCNPIIYLCVFGAKTRDTDLIIYVDTAYQNALYLTVFDNYIFHLFVFRMKHHFPVPFIKTFQRCFAVHHSDYYISVLCRVLLSDYYKISVLDSDVNHTVAVRMKNKQIPTAENRSRKRYAFLYLLHRVNRLSARDRTDDRRNCNSARLEFRQHINAPQPCSLYSAIPFESENVPLHKIQRTHIHCLLYLSVTRRSAVLLLKGDYVLLHIRQSCLIQRPHFSHLRFSNYVEHCVQFRL